MKKIYFSSLFVIMLLLSASIKAQDNVIDEVIWIVGDDAILKSDVENARLQMQMNGQHLSGDPYCIIPEQIAIQKLFLHQAKIDSITVNESLVMQYVEEKINHSIAQVGTKEKFEEYVGKTVPEVREEWRETVRDQEIVKSMQKKIIGSVKVNPVEVRQFYSKIPQDSLPYMQTTVEVEIITIEPTIALSEIDRIKNQLREYTDMVNKGEYEFSTLARLYSQDKESAKRGGELGLQGKGFFVPEFAAVAFDLNDPKKISRIVETEYGFHIMQLVEKRGDRINVRHILLRPEVSPEEIQQATLKIDTIRTNIVNGKYTFEEAATYLSYDKDTRNNNGLLVNAPRMDEMQSDRTGTSRFEMSELPVEVATAVNKLQVGEISEPFQMINKNQKDIIAIVKLKARVPGHKANIADDYQALKAIVEGQKREEILNKWITKKQKETYIRIDDNWKNCDFERDGWVK